MTATSQANLTKVGTATLTVTKDILLQLYGGTASAYPGDTIRLQVNLQGGSSPNGAVIWTQSGGTLTPLANYPMYADYQVPSTPGTYTVTATSVEDPSKSSTISVVVLDPSVVAMSVTPTSISGAPLGTANIAVTVRGGTTQAVQFTATGGTLGPIYRAENGPVTQNYQLPGVAGSYQVLVKSIDDPTKTLTVPVSVVAATTPTIHGIGVQNQVYSEGSSAQVLPYFTAVGSTATLDHNIGAVTNGGAYSVRPNSYTQYLLALGTGRSKLTKLSDWVAPMVQTTAVAASDFSTGAALGARGSGYTLTQLQDGSVLVAGSGHGGSMWPFGTDDGQPAWPSSYPLPDARIFHPATGATGVPIPFRRGGHSALLLSDGRVFAVGGDMASGSILVGTFPNGTYTYTLYSTTGTWEVLDPLKNTSTQGGSFKARDSAAVAQLLDGRVAVIGGNPNLVRINSDRPNTMYWVYQWGSTYVDLIDLKTNAISSGNLLHERNGAAAILMGDGKVLVAGGANTENVQGFVAPTIPPVEVFDTKTMASTVPACFNLFYDSQKQLALSVVTSASRLWDGRVALTEYVIATKTDWIGVYDPLAGTYTRKIQCPSGAKLGSLQPDGLITLGFGHSTQFNLTAPNLFYFDSVKGVVVSSLFLSAMDSQGFSGGLFVGPVSPGVLLAAGGTTAWALQLEPLVRLFPADISIPPGQSSAFSASSSRGEAITWSVLEGAVGGSVSSTGVYRSPATAGIYHVVASTPSGKAVATVCAIPAPPKVNLITLNKNSGPVGTSVTVSWDVLWGDNLHLQARDTNGLVLDDLDVTGQTSTTVTVKSGTTRFTLVASNASGQVESSQYFTLWSVNAVTISPAGTSYVVPGGTFKFAAMVSGTTGTPTMVTWTPLDGGFADADGTYHAPSVAGIYHLQAASTFDPTKTAQVTIVVGYAVNSVRINPMGTTYLNPGQSKAFSVVVSVVPGTPNSVIWTTPDGGGVDGNGLFTAPSQSGTYHLKATSTYDATKFDTVTVVVGISATLTRFSADPQVVSPGKSSTLSWDSQGDTTRILRIPMDEYGNGGASWDVTYYSGFTATPSKTTTYTLSVSNPFGGESKTLTVTVSPVTDLSITPTTATAYVGATKAFGASITSTGSTEVTWSTDDPGGSIAGNGLSAIYTPSGTPGVYHVTVTSVLDPTRKATAEVSVILPQVTLSITPTDTGLVTGQSLSLGSSIQVTGSSNASLVWTCSGGTLLPKGASAFYTAPLTAGTYTVTATSVANPEVSATATIQVATASTPTPYLFAMPSAATLRLGQRLFIGVSYGIADPSAGLAWTASGGTLAIDSSTASAFFSAATEGTYTVSIASRFDPTLTAQVAVRVVPLEAWTITPSALTLATGQAAFFEAAEATGIIVPNAVWSIQEAPLGGSITLPGQYFAPTTAGTYHVIASNPENPAQTATATVTVVAGGGGGNGNGGGSTPTNQGVTVAPETSNIPAGTYQSLSAVVSGMDDQAVTWAVENQPLAANVDASGVFTANQPGTYRVFATSTANPALNGSAVLAVVSSVTVIPTAPLNLTLRGYTVTALNDGRILIAGGTDGTTYYRSARLYDPETKAFLDAPSMLTPRAYHSATLLKDGRVLLAGGVGTPDPDLGGISNNTSAEVFNPQTNLFEALPARPTPNGGNQAGYMRSAHASSKLGDWMETDGHGQSVSTVLSNGQVLIAGGPMVTGSWSGGPIAELGALSYYRNSDVYTPGTDTFDVSNWDSVNSTWATTPNSILTRKGTQVVTLDDGTALMTGGMIKPINGGGPCGIQVNGYGACALSETKIFDPTSGFRDAASLKEPRAYHTMTKLPDGKVLVVGGYKAITLEGTFSTANSDVYHPVPTATAEVYDPATGSFTFVGNLREARARHAAILLPTGKVMIVGGKTEDGDGYYSWPKTTELYDPETGTFSVMDHLEYGLSDPKLALMSDGNVFIAGQIQAPMEQTAASNSMKGSRAAALAPGTPWTTGSSLFGTVGIALGHVAYPEEAAILKVPSLTSSGVADLNSSSGLPRRSVISIPLPSTADPNPASSPLWQGKNQRKRFFLLNFMKPVAPGQATSDTFELSGIQVTREVVNRQGGVENIQVILGVDAPQPLLAGVFEQIHTRSDIPYVEPVTTITDSKELKMEKDREVLRKQWTQSWLPAQALSSYSSKLYFRVQIAGSGVAPSTFPYGMMGGTLFSPPEGTLQYTFRVFYKINGQDHKTDITTPSWLVIDPSWSAAQFFKTQWYGDWNNDKWATKATFDWMGNPYSQALLEPLNDITLEHGRNTGHAGHLSGSEADAYHPGYQAFTHSDTRNGSGRDFRDSYLIPYLQIARGDLVNPDITRDHATQVLTDWIRQARSRIYGLMTQSKLKEYGPDTFIYMCRNTTSTTLDIQDCYQLRRLLLVGECDPYSAGGTTYPGLNLAASVGVWGVEESKWIGLADTSHTDHLHCNWATKAIKFDPNGTKED